MKTLSTTIDDEAELQEEIVRIAKKKRRKRRMISFLLVFIFVLLVVAAAWILGTVQAKRNAQEEIAELKTMLQERDETINELTEEPIVVNPVSPEILLQTIYSEITEISELATTEYLFTDAAKFSDYKQIKNWNVPLTEKSFVLKWNGVIKAGVKLDQVSITINEAEKKISVSVPTAEILSYTIDNDSIEILDEKDNIFNNISVNDKVEFDKETEDNMKNRAIENGLLEKAQENAEDILCRLIQSNPTVGNDYEIEFIVNQ